MNSALRAAISLLLLFIVTVSAWAAIPRTISYQGYLTDAGGVPVSSTVSIVFKLYDVPSGGTHLWTETQSVPVGKGIYQVTLGSVTPMTLPFDTQYYLGVAVSGEDEMLPRQSLTSVPYALRATAMDAGTQTITTGADANKGLIVKANSATQSANLQEWQNSTGSAVASVSPAGDMTLTGNLNLPATTATTGIIKSAGQRLIHTYGSNNFFAGINAGNFTATGYNNIGIGYNTLTSNTSGDQNTGIGVSSLYSNTSGDSNTGLGFLALYSNTSGTQNAGIGSYTLNNNTSGAHNTAVGHGGLSDNTTASGNTAVGFAALSNQSFDNSNTLWSSNNTAVGKYALYSNQSTSTSNGINNTALGYMAGYTATPANANTTGYNNTFIGANSGPGTTTQLTNATAIGYNALVSQSNSLVLGGTGADAVRVGIGTTAPGEQLELTQNLRLPVTTATTGIIKSATSTLLHSYGTYNFFAGRGAGNLTTTGTFLSAAGPSALTANTSGSYNTATGAAALIHNTAGSYNTASGSDALNANTTGNYNTAVGAAASYANTLGNSNTATGYYALMSNTTAGLNTALGTKALYTQSYDNGGVAWSSSNTAVGYYALYANQPTSTGNGRNNTALGVNAGYTGNSANANTTGSNNTFIGAYSGPGTSTQLTNATAVGYNALVSQNNSLVLGGTGSYAVNVGINTATPQDRLDVNGTIRVNDNQIYLRGSGDTLHGIGWYVSDGFVSGSKDGPVVYGCGGGTLGSTCGGNRAALTWDNAGNVSITGALSKGGGSFKIDHPLDPRNKYLYHSFVESPDMMNIYNGNVTTDGKGFATVELPEWFEALNREFRYQLTVMGKESWARARVYEEIVGNRFMIQTDIPDTRVSWQVTGIRRDAYAENNRIQVEVNKPADERGSCLHPEACN